MSPRTAVCRVGAPFYRLLAQRKRAVAYQELKATVPSSCSHCRSGVLPLPFPGLGPCPRGCSATVGAPLSWGPGSLQAGFPQGWSESLRLAGLRAVWLAWELLSMSLLSSAQKSEAGPWPFSLTLPCLVPRREEPPPPSSPCGAAVAVSL